jgi:predicted component of viral defense system (DUF524 family)
VYIYTLDNLNDQMLCDHTHLDTKHKYNLNRIQILSIEKFFDTVGRGKNDVVIIDEADDILHRFSFYFKDAKTVHPITHFEAVHMILFSATFISNASLAFHQLFKE